MADLPSAFIVLSSAGKMFDTFLDQKTAEDRARSIGGLVLESPVVADHRRDPSAPVSERPAPDFARPHRSVPDVR